MEKPGFPTSLENLAAQAILSLVVATLQAPRVPTTPYCLPHTRASEHLLIPMDTHLVTLLVLEGPVLCCTRPVPL